MINARQAIIILLIGCGLAFALGLGALQGHPLLYFFAATATLVICFSVILFLGFISYRYFPSLPPCVTGKCREPLCYKTVSTEGSVKRYRCKCGIEHLLSYEMKLDVVSDGAVRPFMYKTWYGIWKPAGAHPEGTKHE